MPEARRVSAVDDIRKYLPRLAPVPALHERVILIGVSARRSINAAVAHGHENENVHKSICGYAVMDTTEEGVKGWVVRDIGPAGRWLDAPLRP
jgi:hypothetical protein